MREVLLGVAASLAAVVPAAPAMALDPGGSQFTAGAAAGVTIHRGRPGHSVGEFGGDRDGRSRHGDRRRHSRHGFGEGFAYFGDREYQGDIAWRATSYNDWWHERPWRSYPRWVQSNENCERQWQGGGVWRCEW